MKSWVFLPFLLLAAILQTAVFSNIKMLSGTPDIMLVVIAAWVMREPSANSWYWAIIAGALLGAFSGIPWFIMVLGYGFVVGIARLLQQRVWQAPVSAVFFVVLSGTIVFHLFKIVVLLFLGRTTPVIDSLSLVTLPSAILNLFLVIPVYFVVRELSLWVYPGEEEKE